MTCAARDGAILVSTYRLFQHFQERAGLEIVRDPEQFVHGKEAWQFRFVGLELLPGGPDGGVFVCRILAFDQAQGQAVDE